jgi:hypothetical protein
MNSTENIIKKQNSLATFDDLSKTAKCLAQDISAFLSDEIEELNIYSYVFRSGMERALSRVLSSLYKQAQPVVIFPDSIPGFTMMVFKKTQPPAPVKSAKVARNPVEEPKEAQAIDNVIGRFFNKNQQKVLVIENNDILFALFPVSDTRKNLKEMELYITF